MESGICLIKEEFLLSDGVSQISESVIKNRKRKHVDNNEINENVMSKVAPLANKSKKGRKRGQNKHRPVFKEDRTLHLCHSLIEGPGAKPCVFRNCRYVHDLTQYLMSKGDDLGSHCPIFTSKGYCPRGVTCRFAKSHMDAKGNNIKDERFSPEIPASTLNGITSELQIRLRKRDYDFSKSKDLVSRFAALRNCRTLIKSEPQDALAIKPTGCVIENTVSVFNVKQKPPVDFSNKLVLSPLTTVGNLPFRRICKEFGADITCGEMSCAVPIVKGLTQEWALTKRHKSEDVFGVQICGNNPTIIAQAAQLLQETADVDYIDLNIGCPIDLIYQQGGGSALMRRQNVLEVSVRSCVALSNMPLTVKMRTGVYADKNIAHELLPLVESWGAAAVTIHGRSREQRYIKRANWSYIEECASKSTNIPIIGNGDILSFEEYNEKLQLAPHVSSVMIGRGALIKPWIFKEIKEQKTWAPTSVERFEVLRKFCNYGMEHWGSDTKGVETTRRFLLEWQSFLYRYIPYQLLVTPPQKINDRPQKYRGRDELETLMSSSNSADWIKVSEMLLGSVPDGFTFIPKHKANSY